MGLVALLPSRFRFKVTHLWGGGTIVSIERVLHVSYMWPTTRNNQQIQAAGPHAPQQQHVGAV